MIGFRTKLGKEFKEQRTENGFGQDCEGLKGGLEGEMKHAMENVGVGGVN